MGNKDTDILRGELIGVAIAVDNNIHGITVDETKNTITLKTKNGSKKFIKKNHRFSISSGGKSIEVEGKLLVSKPEDRIKLRI